MTFAQAPALELVWEQLPRKEALLLIRHECKTRQVHIRQQRKAIARLRWLENALASIDEFPTELLVQIFAYLVESQAGTQDLIRVTHVCARWRDVALGAAKLWTTFSLNNPALAREFLQRSRRLPLAISLKSAGSRHTAVDFIVPQVHRLRSLNLTAGDDRNLRRLLARLQSPAPKLEELVVEKFARDARRFTLVDRPLFAGDMPSLRSLSTVNVDLSVVLPSPSALVYLNISSNRALIGKELLDMLDRCPKLETFIYAGSPGFHADDVPFNRVVSLPHLKSLLLDFHSPIRTAALLSHLSLSSSTKLRVKTTHEEGAVHGYSMFPENAHDRLKCLAGIKRLELFLDFSLVTLRAYHEPDAYIDPAVEVMARGVLDAADVLRDWPFDVSHVETFVVTGLKQGGLEIWDSALEGMSDLKCLRGVDVDAMSLIALLDRLSRRTRDADGALHCHLCPKLTTLELYDVLPWKAGEQVLPGLIEHMAVKRAKLGMLEEVHLFNVGPVKEACMQLMEDPDEHGEKKLASLGGGAFVERIESVLGIRVEHGGLVDDDVDI